MASRMAWAMCALALALGTGAAQEKHGQAELNQSLREAINIGADLYNRFGDHAGCYRVYQGALVAVKPFLPPDLQQKVTKSLDRAERMPIFSDRAFELRAVIDEVRDRTRPQTAERKPVAEPKPEPQPKVEKKVVVPKVVEPKVEKKVDAPKAVEPKKLQAQSAPASGSHTSLSGKVTLAGQPLPGGYFVHLLSDEGRSFITAVQNGGAFEFRTLLPPGKYRMQIETFLATDAPPAGLALPPRYGNVATSGLSLDLQPGVKHVEVNLVR